jgi:2-amino-4-hydroxy-6-hydroxymethyldihydropteridine diphosphokinase
MYSCYLGLGSNLGDRLEFLIKAVAALEENPEIRVLKLSNVYETEPVGFREQADFLNMVIAIDTSLPPLELLETVLAIEEDLERQRELRWGPRTIDIDLLIVGNERVEMERLHLPHPRIRERLFVLYPLKEIILPQAQEEIIPDLDDCIMRLQKGEYRITFFKSFANNSSERIHSIY